MKQNQLSTLVDKEICTWNNQQFFHISRIPCLIFHAHVVISNYYEISQKCLIVNMVYGEIHPPFYFSKTVSRKAFIVSLFYTFRSTICICYFLSVHFDVNISYMVKRKSRKCRILSNSNSEHNNSITNKLRNEWRMIEEGYTNF